MPTSYQIEPSLACIFVTLYGIVSDIDLIEGQQRLFGDPLFRGHYSRFIDGTALTELLVTGDTIRALARAAVQRGLRKAAFVASGDHTYGMMRMYEGYAAEADCFVSRDSNEALAWLVEKTSSGTGQQHFREP